MRGTGLLACVECVIGQESQDPLIPDRRVLSGAGPVRARPIQHVRALAAPDRQAQVDGLVDLLRVGMDRAMAVVRREGFWEA